MIAATAAGALLSLGLNAAPAQAAGTSHGCASGYVCIYQNLTSYNNGQPSHRYYNYGSYNLSGQYGTKHVFNNQTDGARARFCWGYNGTNCWGDSVPAGETWQTDFTPINSIRLEPALSQ